MSNSVGNEAVVIGSKLPVDDLGELALQATQRLPGSLVLGELSVVVILAETGVHHLHPRSEVQCVVQRALSSTTQPDDGVCHRWRLQSERFLCSSRNGPQWRNA